MTANEIRVRFCTEMFHRSHGYSPRGAGTWAFAFGREIERDDFDPWFAPGCVSFTEAKKLARAEAQRRGFSGIVTVLS